MNGGRFILVITDVATIFGEEIVTAIIGLALSAGIFQYDVIHFEGNSNRIKQKTSL
jgi:hypothetical protein